MPREDLIQLRAGTAAQWTSVNPVLATGECGCETDTGAIKVGDGSTAWAALSYVGSGGGSTPTQVSGAEKTAGTETGLRSFSPLDVADMALTHGPGGTPDHGTLTGLGDDDHTIYLLADGTRTLAGSLTVTGTVDGRDVAADGTKLDGIAAGATNNSGALADLDTVGATEIDDEAVTLAKLAHIATDSFLGRDTAGAGDVEVLSAAAVRTILNVEDGATADQTGAEIKVAYEAEANTNAFTDAEQTKLSGIATGATNNSGALADLDSVDSAQIDMAAVGTTQLADEGVTLAKLAHLVTDRILGRVSVGTGDVEALTAAQVRTLLNVEDGATADQTAAEVETAYNAQVAQVSTGERTAGTETAVRRFSPADVASMAGTHGGGGGSYTPVWMKRTGSASFAVTSTPTSPAWATELDAVNTSGEITFSAGVFTVTNAGTFRFGGYICAESAAQRPQFVCEVYVNGTGTGDQRGGAYIRNSGISYDHWTVEVATEPFDLAASDTIELRVGQVTGPTYGYGGSATVTAYETRSRVWIEKVG